jgi:hypothetical protein
VKWFGSRDYETPVGWLTLGGSGCSCLATPLRVGPDSGPAASLLGRRFGSSDVYIRTVTFFLGQLVLTSAGLFPGGRREVQNPCHTAKGDTCDGRSALAFPSSVMPGFSVWTGLFIGRVVAWPYRGLLHDRRWLVGRPGFEPGLRASKAPDLPLVDRPALFPCTVCLRKHRTSVAGNSHSANISLQ